MAIVGGMVIDNPNGCYLGVFNHVVCGWGNERQSTGG